MLSPRASQKVSEPEKTTLSLGESGHLGLLGCGLLWVCPPEVNEMFGFILELVQQQGGQRWCLLCCVLD